MNFVRVLAASLLATTFAVAGCATQTDSAADSSSAESNGFGEDSIFDSMITGPDVIATKDCPDFGIKAGDRLDVTAEEGFFAVGPFEGAPVFSLTVPSEASYVWTGSSPDRSTTKIVSKSRGVEAFMNSNTAAVTLQKTNDAASACVLDRCPAFGPCN